MYQTRTVLGSEFAPILTTNFRTHAATEICIRQEIYLSSKNRTHHSIRPHYKYAPTADHSHPKDNLAQKLFPASIVIRFSATFRKISISDNFGEV